MANGALEQQGPPMQGGDAPLTPEDMVPEFEGQENQELFPANKKEVIEFINNMVDVLYDNEDQVFAPTFVL